MKIERPRVYTIAPGGHFLDVLAKEILAGFPFDETQDSRPLLSDWTILLPTRRAARALSRMLYEKAGHKTLLLPNIRPIGDLDEEHLAQNSEGDLPNASSATGQLFIMLELLHRAQYKSALLVLVSETRYRLLVEADEDRRLLRQKEV